MLTKQAKMADSNFKAPVGKKLSLKMWFFQFRIIRVIWWESIMDSIMEMSMFSCDENWIEIENLEI